MTKKNEHLKFLIDRFDHYYDTINSKCNAYLVVNTFSIGGVGVFYTALQSDVKWTFLIKFLGVLLMIIWAVSLLFTAIALMPYQKSAHNSLIFHGGISCLSEDVFYNKISEQTESEIQIDLQKQVYYLSKGLSFKFKMLNYAIYALLTSYPLLIITLFSILLNFKND